MDAQPRLTTGHNLTESQGRRLQALVRAGRNDVAHGSGGKDINRKSASETKTQQLRGSATHPDATKQVVTARKSAMDSRQRSRKPRSESHQPATTHPPRALPTHPDTAWNLNHAKASPEGQTARAGARQNGTSQQFHQAALPNQMPRSKSQQ